MGKRWKNPPWDKKEVRRREVKFPHLRKAKDYKENCQHLHRFNKGYRKKFDTENRYQFYSDVKQYMDTFGIYKGMQYLVKNGYFTIDYIGRRRIIPSSEVEEELFRREMCTFRDWVIWNHDKSREYAKRNTAYAKRRTRRFILTSPDNRKIWFGRYDTRRFSLAKDVAAFLMSNPYIFDKNSEYYLTDSELRSFVRQKMMSRSFLNKDFKALILAFKEKSHSR